MSYGFIWGILLVLAISSVKIARESQRFAVYRLGRFWGLKGPGIIFMIPGIDKCTKINVGDQGELIAQDMARIRKTAVPVVVVGSVEIGKTVRIQSFMEREAVVVDASAQTQEFA